MKEATQDQGLKLVSLRLPVQLHRQIEAEAKREHRSLNAHLNFLIAERVERGEAA